MPVTRIARSALLPYAQADIYALVSDIENYPLYMEGCIAARILNTQGDIVEACLQLGKGGIQQNFTTRNTLLHPHHISMQLVEGPFRSFRGLWEFKALDTSASKVSLDLQFELDNQLANMAAGKVFESVATNLVDNLCQRAHSLYGKQP